MTDRATSYRLDTDDLALIDKIKKELVKRKIGKSNTDVIRYAIRSYADVILGNQNESTPGKEDSAVSDAVAALTAQLDAKDRQIAELTEALRAEQQTAQAAQMLHARERLAIEEEKKRRWRLPWFRRKE